MNYNSENYGFEQIKADNKILKNDKAVEFSKKILNAIKAKAKEHNATSPKKVTFAQLKKVYKNNIDILNSEKNFNQVAFARVNMFLRMVNGVSSYLGANSNFSKAINNNYIIEASFNPTPEDFIKADEDIKSYDLNDFEFNNPDDLYLDDEEDRVIYGLDNL
jgi:hypothetical protein